MQVFFMKNEGNSVFKKPMDFFYTKGKKLNSLGSQSHRMGLNRGKGKTTSFLADLAERCPDPISLADFDRLRTVGFS